MSNALQNAVKLFKTILVADAKGDGTDDRAAIEAVIDAVAASGGGTVILPAGEFGISESSGTLGPSGLAHGLRLSGGVTLVGQGIGTVLKRIGATSYTLVNILDGDGAGVRNLRIDGQASVLTVSDRATSLLGHGILIESTSVTESKNVTVQDVWIDDVLGYGVGAEWGHTRGLTLRNINIDGCGADGVDIKRFNHLGSPFDCYGLVLDNIRVTDFGRQATDAAQAGIDIRGYCTATNLHVYGVWGKFARAGIRLRGGEAGDNSIGAQRSSVTNYVVSRDSGGEATTWGVEVNAPNTSTAQGAVFGCSQGVGHFPVGVAALTENITHMGVKAFGCTFGFWSGATSHRISYIGCEATGNTSAGYYIAGNDVRLVTPVFGGTQNYHIQIVATATGTKVVFPIYGGTATTGIVSDAGAQTLRIEANDIQLGDSSFNVRASGQGRVLEVATTAGDSRITIQRGTGRALVSAASDTAADADLVLAPVGTGVIVVPIASVRDYADDAAAATGGVPVGGIYHNAGATRIRRS